MAFRFEKPLGFSFDPGQAIDLIHIDPPTTGTAAARYTFSLVTAPWEDDLAVATRMRSSPFKRFWDHWRLDRQQGSRGRSDR